MSFVQDGERLDFTNGTGANIAYNDVVTVATVTDKIFIAAEDILDGATGTVHTVGVFELPADNTQAFIFGEQLYWDATNKKLTRTATSNTKAGYAAALKTQTSTTGRVKIG